MMVRGSTATGIAVKGRAANILMDATPTMRIANISDKGILHISTLERVQVEFVMMSTKVVFVANVVAREQNSILVSLPSALVSIERRKNARYNTTDDMLAFLDLSMWKPLVDDVTAPPFYPQYRSLSGFLSVSDLSFGGLCVVTRFPAVNTVLRRGLIDDRARLILPMQDPLVVGVEIRWFKRIKEHVKTGEGDSQALMRSYRFGVEFISQSDDVRLSIRQFIQQLSQAGAI